MKSFKTIFILEIVSGLGLRRNGTFRGVVDVVAYLCGMGGADDFSSPEQFFVCMDINGDVINEEIINQHPSLKSITEEVSELEQILEPENWFKWGEDKINALGEELILSPISSDKIVKVLPAQNFTLN